MDEYIKRKTVIDLITRRYENPEICTQEINSIPAADVVPVVRCKDCKHLVAVNVNGKGISTCRVSGMEVAPDEFCSRQELGHANRLHEMAVRHIEKAKDAGLHPTEAMQAVWDWEHERMLDRAAHVKTLLSMM